MKKFILLLFVIFAGFSMQAQSTNAVDKMVERDVDWLKKTISYTEKNVTLNQNQLVKLERIFKEKAEKVVALRAKSLEKIEYQDEFYSIDKEYSQKIEKVLTPVQKIEFKKNKDKQIQKMSIR